MQELHPLVTALQPQELRPKAALIVTDGEERSRRGASEGVSEMDGVDH